MTKGIIYYTDLHCDEKILKMCQDQLLRIGLPIVSVSLKPLDFGKNIYLPLERGYETYFKQIVTALENSDTDIVYFTEHDVLYAKEHFDFTPPRDDTFYYDLNVWRWKYPENFCVTWDAHQVAQLVCYRKLALDWYRKKLAEYQNAPVKTTDKNHQLGNKVFDRKFEPEDKFENYRASVPSLDIRHGANLTKSKWSLNDFRDKRTCVNWQEGELPQWIKSIWQN